MHPAQATSPFASSNLTVPRLILASASPQRQALLRAAGFHFHVHPANVDEETHLGTLPPAELAIFLANLKATSVSSLFPDDVTLAADTVVALGDRSLGKAADEKEARAMLEMLSGSTHQAITGVAVHAPARGIQYLQAATSEVRMRHWTAPEIDAYVASGDWRGKAGAYGIQDNDPVVERISGSHSNIIGLPMELTTRMLAKAGIIPQGC